MTEIFNASDLSKALDLPALGSAFLNAESIPWQESDEPGFLMKPLLQDEISRMRTWLMKVEPGAFPNSMPMKNTSRFMCCLVPFMIRSTSTGPGIS